MKIELDKKCTMKETTKPFELRKKYLTFFINISTMRRKLEGSHSVRAWNIICVSACSKILIYILESILNLIII